MLKKKNSPILMRKSPRRRKSLNFSKRKRKKGKTTFYLIHWKYNFIAIYESEEEIGEGKKEEQGWSVEDRVERKEEYPYHFTFFLFVRFEITLNPFGVMIRPSSLSFSVPF